MERGSITLEENITKVTSLRETDMAKEHTNGYKKKLSMLENLKIITKMDLVNIMKVIPFMRVVGKMIQDTVKVKSF